MSHRDVEIILLKGYPRYQDVLNLQMKRVKQIKQSQASNTVFVLEHSPVITLGRRSNERHILRTIDQLTAVGIEVQHSDRGGDVTYHGPGQIVVYPILNLQQWKKSIRWYLRMLEEVVIRLLNCWGLEATRQPPFTGVWVNGAKIAAVGVGLRNWITYHGFSLNVDPNMVHFDLIIPCGLKGKPVTSLARILPHSPDIEKTKRILVEKFCDVFDANPCRCQSVAVYSPEMDSAACPSSIDCKDFRTRG